MQTTPTLILNKICPFAERALLTLEEKKVPYSLTEVSLKEKSPYFTEMYKKAYGHDPKSDGKVPIFVDGDRVLTESDLISWYVAEKYESGTQLIPKDPFETLKMRHFIANTGKVIGGFYGFIGFQKKSKQDKQKFLTNLDTILQQFNDSLVLPYATGTSFTLADILSYPWFPRWCAIETGIGVGLDKKYTRIHEWVKNVGERDSAKSVKQPNQFYIEGYSQYFN